MSVPSKAIAKPPVAVVNSLLMSIRTHMPIERAAAFAGVSVDQIRQWVVAHADFADKLQKAQFEAEKSLVRKIEEAAESDVKHWKAAAWLLERAEKKTAAPSVTINLGQTEPQTGPYTRDVIDAEPDPGTSPLSAILRARLDTIKRDTDRARAANSHVAVDSMQKQYLTTLKEYRQALKDEQQGDTLESESEARFMTDLHSAAMDMPEAHLRVFADAWLNRHRMKAVPADLETT